MCPHVSTLAYHCVSVCVCLQRGEHSPEVDHSAGELRSSAPVHAVPERPEDGAVCRIGGAEPSTYPHAGASHTRDRSVLSAGCAFSFLFILLSSSSKPSQVRLIQHYAIDFCLHPGLTS